MVSTVDPAQGRADGCRQPGVNKVLVRRIEATHDDRAVERLVDLVLTLLTIALGLGALVWLTASRGDPVQAVAPLVAMLVAWVLAGLASVALHRR